EISKASPNLSDDTLSTIVNRILYDSRMRFMPPPPSLPLPDRGSAFGHRSGKSTRRILPGFLFSRNSFDSTSYEEIHKKFMEELQLNGIKASFDFAIISKHPDSLFPLEGQDMPLLGDRRRDRFHSVTESGLNIRPLLIDAEESRFI